MSDINEQKYILAALKWYPGLYNQDGSGLSFEIASIDDDDRKVGTLKEIKKLKEWIDRDFPREDFKIYELKLCFNTNIVRLKAGGKMKELKFRAWDIEEKKMIYSNYSGDEYFWKITAGRVCCCRLNIGEMYENGPKTSYEIPLEGNIMQYICCDPWENEIYENDIIGFSCYEEYELIENLKGKISFDSERSAFVIVTKDTVIPFDTNIVEPKVLGNIYENPELMEVK